MRCSAPESGCTSTVKRCSTASCCVTTPLTRCSCSTTWLSSSSSSAQSSLPSAFSAAGAPAQRASASSHSSVHSLPPLHFISLAYINIEICTTGAMKIPILYHCCKFSARSIIPLHRYRDCHWVHRTLYGIILSNSEVIE